MALIPLYLIPSSAVDGADFSSLSSMDVVKIQSLGQNFDSEDVVVKIVNIYKRRVLNSWVTSCLVPAK